MNTEHWVKNEHFCSFLFFCQVLNESLSPVAYESYKLPALNSHYLCYDLLATSMSVENKSLLMGNFVPLFEEFEYVMSNDLYIRAVLTDCDTLFLAKNANGEMYDLRKNGEYKAKIKPYLVISEYIKGVCESEVSSYTYTLEYLLKKAMLKANLTKDELNIIYVITRDLLVDYVNYGYSKEYLVKSINAYFFDSSHEVLCNESCFDNFFRTLEQEKKKYLIVYSVKSSLSNFIAGLKGIKIREPNNLEINHFKINSKKDKIAEFEYVSLDPYSAFEKAESYKDLIISLSRMGSHKESKGLFSKLSLVYDTSDKDTPIFPNSKLNHMKNTVVFSRSSVASKLIDLANQQNIPSSFYKAVALHKGACESNEVSYQILNLWTVLEILIDYKHDNGDEKISSICTVLIPILCRRYLYSKFENLLNDLKTYSNDVVKRALGDVRLNKLQNDVFRIAKIVTVDDYMNLRDDILASLEKNPVLQYRIEHFRYDIAESNITIFNYLDRHSRRLKLQIMRIYRCRNMIVHDGQQLPYIDPLVENLHFYVDTLFDTLIEYYNYGLNTNSSIYQDVINEQAKHYVKLGFYPKTRIAIATKRIDNDNCLDLLFNDFQLNFINSNH